MDYINEFVDRRQKAWCIHCGDRIDAVETSRDHVPSKSLLLKPYPPNLPVITICKACNSSFSQDEEYLVAFLGAVLSGSTDPAHQFIPSAKRIFSDAGRLSDRINREKQEQLLLLGGSLVYWKSELARIENVAVKNARGHVFYEYGEPMLIDPQSVWVAPLSSLSKECREEFERVGVSNVFPEVGSRMMTRMLTGQDLDEAWVVVQDNVYRYALAPCEGMLVRIVLYEYLAVEIYWE